MQRWPVPNRLGVLFVFLMILCLNTAIASNQNQITIQRLDVIVEKTISHNSSSWTQGLLIKDGYIYESTGKFGESSLQKINMSTGEVVKTHYHNDSIFAEGLTFDDNKLIQLTYLSNIAFVFDIESFEIINVLNYTGEGWGICTMADFFVMSNGTNQLAIRDLVTFELINSVNVTKDGTPIHYLNELECVNNTVYSNVWLTDEIVLIDINTGNISKSINAEGLLNESESQNADVLNGIAFDEINSEFWITGKYWPNLFQVIFEENKSIIENNTNGNSESDDFLLAPPCFGLDAYLIVEDSRDSSMNGRYFPQSGYIVDPQNPSRIIEDDAGVYWYKAENLDGSSGSGWSFYLSEGEYEWPEDEAFGVWITTPWIIMKGTNPPSDLVAEDYDFGGTHAVDPDFPDEQAPNWGESRCNPQGLSIHGEITYYSDIDDSEIYIYSLMFLLIISTVIWMIDIKLRGKTEKTQVQDGSGE